MYDGGVDTLRTGHSAGQVSVGAADPRPVPALLVDVRIVVARVRSGRSGARGGRGYSVAGSPRPSGGLVVVTTHGWDDWSAALCMESVRRAILAAVGSDPLMFAAGANSVAFEWGTA